MPPRLSCSAPRRLGEAITRSSRVSPSQSLASSMPMFSAVASRSGLRISVLPPTKAGYATAATLSALRLPDDYVPPTQPPSARPPEARKSQLLRTYTQLLRSTPLVLILQHSNLTATEWAAVRRELYGALKAVSPTVEESGIQIQVIRTRIFDVALKTVEFFDPASVPAAPAPAKGTKPRKDSYKHDLSTAAFEAVKAGTKEASPSTVYSQLQPLLMGPMAVVTFPTVSPAHLAAALSILSPQAPKFPAPTRKKHPGYWDPACQSALQKLLLVGGRVEGKVFDMDGVRWVGGIDGGMESLRAQLVYMLQSAGMGLTTALEGASKNLWLTMESRRSVLEEEGKTPEEKTPEEKTPEEKTPVDQEKQA